MLDRFHKMAEIVASIAIVASLIFVGIQVSQNTTATSSQTHQFLLQDETRTSELLITHPEVAALVLTGETNPEHLSEIEWARFSQFAMRRFGTWEAAHMNFEDGLVEPDMMEAWNAYFPLLLNKPGYRAFWQERRLTYYTGFRTHVETVLFP